MILFSLIIPIFNKKDFIYDTLKSIVDNHEINEQQFECILVDEESNDGTELICQEFVKTYSTNLNYKFLECKPWYQSEKNIEEFYEKKEL